MKNLFEAAFLQEQEIIRAYDAADLIGDEAGKAAARTAHKTWEQGLPSQVAENPGIYRTYAEARRNGNDNIDFHDVIWDKEVPGLIATLRQLGIEKFTFSSGWSSAVETAWLFQQNGCSLQGLVEVNGNKDCFTGDHEKRHGYLFSLN